MSKRSHNRLIVWNPFKGDAPFIIAVFGRFSTGFLCNIETEIEELGEEFTAKYPENSEIELSKFSFFPGQHDEYGRCEVWPYWNWDERFLRKRAEQKEERKLL